MKRIGLLLGIVAMTVLLAGTVALFSPYAPVVAPVVEIEEIWAIEDARTESEEPLITVLENHGMRLGYDARENTFYCTLGFETGGDWPEIHLTAPDAQDEVQLVFVDDYSYDWCDEAIREGYPYQILTYTDEEFFYTQVVFTALPIVTLTTDVEIPPHADVPVDVSMSWQGEEPFFSTGRAHKRGAISLRVSPKHGIKVEFTRGGVGGNKVHAKAPFLDVTEEMTLLACSIDPLMIRDKLCWDVYNSFMDEREAFGDVQTRYVELFVNEDYHGVYLLMKKYDYAQEIRREAAEAALTDSFYRAVMAELENLDRPGTVDHQGRCYEQHYAPAGETDLQGLKPYLELIALEDDAVFSQRVLEQMDLDSVIRYVLFVQACALTDNEINNMGIWAHRENGNIKYHYVPWDLDMSWGIDKHDAEYWYGFELFDRMLRLDCGGIVRTRTLEIWQEMREKAFNAEVLDVLLADYDQQLNASGAYYRDSLRWESHGEVMDTYNTYSYALDRFAMMDRRIEEMAGAYYKDRQILMDHYEIQDVGALDDALRGLTQ